MWPQRRQPTRLPRPWDSPGKNTGVGCHFLLQCMKVKSESEVAQSCPTLSDSMDYSLPASSAHGIFQARVLEWGAIMWSQMWKICISSSIYCLSVYDYMKTIGISFPDSLLGSCLVCDCQAPIPSTVVPKEWPILSAEHAHHWWRPGFDPWVGKIPWRRAWQPSPVFGPGESPWTEEPGGLWSTGLQRVGHNWATFTFSSRSFNFNFYI